MTPVTHGLGAPYRARTLDFVLNLTLQKVQCESEFTVLRSSDLMGFEQRARAFARMRVMVSNLLKRYLGLTIVEIRYKGIDRVFSPRVDSQLSLGGWQYLLKLAF